MIRKSIFLLSLLAAATGRQLWAQQQTTAPRPASPEPASSSDTTEATDGSASLSLFYWLNTFSPTMRTGRATTDGTSADLDFPGKSNQTPGITVSIPAGKGNILRFTYFRTQGHGDVNAPRDLLLFGTSFTTGDFLNTSYKLQNVKVSWNYLSWPFPARESTFRLKTLWEVQYTTIRTTIDAPLVEGTVDTTTGLVSYPTVVHSYSLIYPSLGLGVEKFFGNGVRWEAQGSGFALPHLPSLWDAETFLAFRHGRVEVRLGAKGFHFKTSQRLEQYVSGTPLGAYVGVTFYP